MQTGTLQPLHYYKPYQQQHAPAADAPPPKASAMQLGCALQRQTLCGKAPTQPAPVLPPKPTRSTALPHIGASEESVNKPLAVAPDGTL